MLTLSHSQIDVYQKCRRLYRYQYIQGLRRRVVAVPLIAGRAFHAFKEAWYEGLPLERGIAALNKEFASVTPQDRALLNKDQLAQLAIEQHRMVAIATAYADAYRDDRTQYKKFLTESSVTIPLIEGVEYKGYIDCLVQDAAGDWWIMETKTAASGTVNQDYYDRVNFDWQVAGYAALAQDKLGVMPKGIVYDVIIKTRHSIKQGESPAGFVQRLTHLYVNEWKTQGLLERNTILLSDKTIDRWLKQVKLIAAEIRDAVDRKEKNWPMNTGNCLGKYGTCSHMPICVNGKVDKLLYVKK